MRPSVVVPTLNGCDRLCRCLDVLASRAPDTEVVVVNGPSTDGTTGMVKDRDDVDVLLEVPERNVNVARNAGIRAASGDVVAILDDGVRVGPDWRDALLEGFDDGADVVTGPRHRELPGGVATSAPESDVVGGRTVEYFDAGNVAFTARTLSALDGFDEYLPTGGSRDLARRLAGQERDVEWAQGMRVRHDLETDGGTDTAVNAPRPVAEHPADAEWGWKYRSQAYSLTKNYGVRPGVVRRVAGDAVGDAVSEGTEVFRGDSMLSTWGAVGRSVLAGICRGGVDGLRSRFADRRPRRNPNGVSTRDDRAVSVYDWR